MKKTLLHFTLASLGLLPVVADAPWSYVQLQAFGAMEMGGANPSAAIIEGDDGALYGTTPYGGSSNGGTIFRLNRDGSGFQILRNFGSIGEEGSTPQRELVQSSDGALYGTTSYGGTTSGLGFGTVFKLDPDGSGYAVLHRFGIAAADGKYPSASLAARDGVLYGTTYDGGSGNNGTVFRLNQDGNGYVVLRNFSGGQDAAGPHRRLVVGSDGALYGLTLYAGSNNFAGAVFKINTNGSGYSVVRRFSEAGGDPACPCSGLIEGGDGKLYGTSIGGGTDNFGTVFAVNKDGSAFTLLHSFVGAPPDGMAPNSLTEGTDGALYGTTSGGGRYYGGTAFELNKDGSGFVVLHHFGRTSQDGREPYGLGKARDGALHGTTSSGGAMAAGTVFSLLPEHRSWFRTSAPSSSAIATLNALGAADTDFRLQASASLAPSSWWDVTTNTASEVGALSFTNLPTDHPQVFYRLVTP